jgi:hypothetical protein
MGEAEELCGKEQMIESSHKELSIKSSGKKQVITSNGKNKDSKSSGKQLTRSWPSPAAGWIHYSIEIVCPRLGSDRMRGGGPRFYTGWGIDKF